MDTAHRADKHRNKKYWEGYSGMPVEERTNGYVQRGETQNRIFKVRTIDVEVTGNASADWLWAIHKAEDFCSEGVDSFFHGSSAGKEKDMQRLKEEVEDRRFFRGG